MTEREQQLLMALITCEMMPLLSFKGEIYFYLLSAHILYKLIE